jgi:DNA polymerase elongation subunit (family B)
MKKPELRTKRKRLFIDIETSENIGTFWRAGYKQSISYQNILWERGIICICYKWEDEKEIYSLEWDSKQSDKKMLERFVDVLNVADEIVGHNIDKFDLAFIRTRCLVNRVDIYPSYKTLDTLKIARRNFALQSNKLDYIAQLLGLGGKIKTEYSWWREILIDKNKDAMAKMVKYCKKDVKLLEDVFRELIRHTEPKMHYGVIFGQDRGSCPECGSTELTVSMRRTTATGLKKIQYKCQTCNRYHSKTDK